MNQDAIPLIITGFGTILLILTTVTLDRSLFPMKAGYWSRFAFLGIRYGLAAFVIWVAIVLFPFL